MDVGEGRWTALGSVHRIPVVDTPGGLHLCGLEVVGPDPVAVLDHVSARTVVCLQTDDEILRRYPGYLDWLAAPDPHEAIRLPTHDHLVAPDESVVELTRGVLGRLRSGENVLVHCGAGWGRAGLLAVLVMVAAGSSVQSSLRDLRAARPAAGPQSSEQDEQIARLAGRVGPTWPV